jgi:hypothetical protein
MNKALHLQVFRAGALVSSHALEAGKHAKLRIGRHEAAQVRLDDPGVARLHAILEVSERGLEIVDLGSIGGTLLNGKRVQRSRLAGGDRLTMGDSLLVVSDAPAPTPTSTASVTPPRQPCFDPNSYGDCGPVAHIDPPRLHAPAVGSCPHPALPPEGAVDADHRLLELRLYWGELLLAVNHYDKPKRLTIGETRRAEVFVSSEGLPAIDFPLVRFVGSDYLLCFTQQMQGETETAEGRHALAELWGSASAPPCADLEGTCAITLTPDSRTIVHWGGVTVALRFVAPACPPKSFFWQSLDTGFANFTLASIAMIVAFVFTLNVYPCDTDALRDELSLRQNRFVGLLVEPPPTSESIKKKLEQIAAKLPPKPRAAAKPEKVDEQAPRVQAKPLPASVTWLPRALAKPASGLSDGARREAIRQQMNKLFGGGASSLLSGGGGGSIAGRLANVIGTTGAGSASSGLEGAGIRGGPQTGGGVGTSLGIPGVSTAGRAGGGDSGPEVALGPRRRHDITELGTPSKIGALAPEVIKRVVDDNRAQIRYCYEHELQHDQALAGHIAVRWVIGAAGNVVAVTVRDSTLANPAVEACIVRKIRTWVFPPPAGGGTVEVNYPFMLKAS